jgi:lysophospholipase L1-like esterase
LKNRVRKLLSTLPGNNGYYAETDRLVEYLLVRLKEDLDKTGTKLLVVHIPPGQVFENGEALSKGKSEPQTAHLRALYAKLEIPFVDLLEALPQGRPLATIYKEHYIHRPDGSIGHFTPKGNAEVAKIITEALKEKGMLKGGS